MKNNAMLDLVKNINSAVAERWDAKDERAIALQKSLPVVRCDKDGGGLWTIPAPLTVGGLCMVTGYHCGAHERRYDNGQVRLHNVEATITDIDGGQVSLESCQRQIVTMPAAYCSGFHLATADDVELAIAVKLWEASDAYPWHMCPSAKALAAQRVNELREQLERLNAPSVRVHQCHSAEVRDLIYSRED